MNFEQLLHSLRELDSSVKHQVRQTANVGLTLRNWMVGAYIVEFEQHGEERAVYGDQLVLELANQLSIKGLSSTTLKLCRTFYLAYPEIRQSLTGEFLNILKTSGLEIGQSLTDFSQTDSLIPVQKVINKLTFTHIVELLRFKDPLQRDFYASECIKSGWSVRELKRQIGSLLFERLGLSEDKEKLLRLTAARSESTQPADIIKDPYIFEFLGLTPKEAFRENDLETALLDHLQEFLLELGCGFCFEDRQKQLRIGDSSYFVDLVFYHRHLHCHVIIELKAEAFNHSNAAQLNTYPKFLIGRLDPF